MIPVSLQSSFEGNSAAVPNDSKSYIKFFLESTWTCD